MREMKLFTLILAFFPLIIFAQNAPDHYSVSSDLMMMIKEMTDGDPKKVQEMLDRAKKDPKAFYDSLPQKIKTRAADLKTKTSPSN
jgi:hypothetical protein